MCLCRWRTPTPMSWGLTWTCCYRSCSLRTPGRRIGQSARSVWQLRVLLCLNVIKFLLFLFLLCRIHNVLKGIPDDRDGLFDTIQRSKNHYQKRAYQCIKCMVALFSNCSVAYQILQVPQATLLRYPITLFTFLPTFVFLTAFDHSYTLTGPVPISLLLVSNSLCTTFTGTQQL